MIYMKVQVGRVNQAIIYVGDNTCPQHIPEDIVDLALEDARSAKKPIGHDQLFVVTSQSAKIRLPFVTLPKMNQIVGPTEVQFLENGGFP